ncbi:MAG: hypothetical protein LBF16_15560 [Pseudomonadales bacterium]|nr:hypothetical protein [Pseudomonadales bacterium]
MHRYKILAVATCLALFAASPSQADWRDFAKQRDLLVQRYEHERHEEPHKETNQSSNLGRRDEPRKETNPASNLERREEPRKDNNQSINQPRNLEHRDEPHRESHPARNDRHDAPRRENTWSGNHERDERGRSNWFYDHGYSRLNIPANYYPALGQCRLWYSDQPLWRQPATQNCRSAQLAAQPGTWIIYRPANDAVHIQVMVYESYYAAPWVGEFDLRSGDFIRMISNF